MKVRSWLRSTCSSSTCISTAKDAIVPPPTPNQLVISDSSSCSVDAQASSSASSLTSQDSTYTTRSHTSLESNLSILTLPSVPSLQKLSPEALNLSITTLCITSLKPQQPAHVNFLALNNNLLYAVSGSQVNVFNTTNFTLFDSFHVNNDSSSSGSIKSLAFCDGKIFTAHQDCRIRVWKLTSSSVGQHKLIATLPTVEDRLRNFILPKNYVKVRRHRKKLWVEHYDAVSSLAAAENLLHSVSWDKYLKIWRAKDFRCTESIKAHDDAINAVAASPGGLIYTGSADKRIRVWGRAFGEKKHVLMATLEKHKSAVNALALNFDGSVLFSGACDRSILVWEREESANHMVVTGALRGHSKAILCLINVCDLLLSGSADRTVRIWHRGHDGRYCCLTVLDGHAKPVRSLVGVAEEDSGGAVKVFSGSFDGEIKVWKVMISSSSVKTPIPCPPSNVDED
ncbi:protein JINGUBANG-like [Coffea arabica]|uniref:Protein JINGUBANG-like n=1 Tax=Coffea arabica TaxID=13443 RepID=A0A6P6V786_COFAR|nr:protein JINGUBANG-like [Coffea arabica]